MRRALSLGLLALIACASEDHKGGDDRGGAHALDGGFQVSLDAALRAEDAETMDASAHVDGEQPEPARLVGITALHNTVRAKLNASPSVAPLVWSPAIAQIAQAYAETLAGRCGALVHSSSEQRMNHGENLASFSDSSRSATRAPGSAAETVALWESERACYSLGPFRSGVHAGCSAECGAYGGCGHYTQLIWRGTRSVGCGSAECKDGQTFRSYWVCHYDPAGNVPDALPY